MSRRAGLRGASPFPAVVPPARWPIAPGISANCVPSPYFAVLRYAEHDALPPADARADCLVSDRPQTWQHLETDGAPAAHFLRKAQPLARRARLLAGAYDTPALRVRPARPGSRRTLDF